MIEIVMLMEMEGLRESRATSLPKDLLCHRRYLVGRMSDDIITPNLSSTMKF